MRLRLSTRILIPLWLVIPAMIAAFLYLDHANRLVTEQRNWVIHTHKVIEQAGDLLSQVKDAETAQRSYLVTGDQAYLELYQQARQNTEQIYTPPTPPDQRQSHPAAASA